MDWLALMNRVTQAIYDDPKTPHRPGNDPDNLVGSIRNQFEQAPMEVRTGLQADSPTGLSQLLGQVQKSICNAPSTPYQQGDQGGGLLNTIGSLFNQYATNRGLPEVRPANQDPFGDPGDSDMPGPGDRNVMPASEDRFGDPAGMESRDMNILPADRDPYGDPAEFSGPGPQRGNVRPASDDPDGDPADQRW